MHHLASAAISLTVILKASSNQCTLFESCKGQRIAEIITEFARDEGHGLENGLDNLLPWWHIHELTRVVEK